MRPVLKNLFTFILLLFIASSAFCKEALDAAINPRIEYHNGYIFQALTNEEIEQIDHELRLIRLANAFILNTNWVSGDELTRIYKISKELRQMSNVIIMGKESFTKEDEIYRVFCIQKRKVGMLQDYDLYSYILKAG
ncbi:hypothetical protein FACS189461_3250 [Spirochaetia bacterium]|nr:hypothetical protein FACS189461_3250 [Spirochaetia bacterium]